MSGRRFAALALVAVLGASLIASCGPEPKTKVKYVQSYLDILLLPDDSCDVDAPVCVSALDVRLSQEGEELVASCQDVVAVLGAPAQSIPDLAVLVGTEIAQDFPASGDVGVAVIAHSLPCGETKQTTVPPVFAGYAEFALTMEDQQVYVPVSCAIPQQPCTPSPSPTPPTCFAGCE